MSLNKAVLVGKVIAPPEKRFTNTDDPVTRLAIETGDNVQLKLVCWKNLASKASSLKEGDLIMASGPLVVFSYKTNSGQNRKDFEVSVRELYLLHGEMENLSPFMAASENEGKTPATAGKKASSAKRDQEEDLSDVLLEEEIPF